jgi:hypothetical protein
MNGLGENTLQKFIHYLLEIVVSELESSERKNARDILKEKSYVKRDGWGYNDDGSIYGIYVDKNGKKIWKG